MDNPAYAFSQRLEETQSGADEVSDFVYKSSTAFPSADVLVPAPMAVAILGQLTLVATATDFKLSEPRGGFHYVRHPNSFRATIMQLVNTGALALNKSFANFDEINKRCAAVRPGVNNIVQLLVGDERNTPRQNDVALERHLPGQIRGLGETIQACLEKAKETDEVFHKLLELTMEIHESCTAAQGANERNLFEADLRTTILNEQKRATEEMKKISSEQAQQAREEYQNAQTQFHDAVKSMPGGDPNPPAYTRYEDVADPGYGQATKLRTLAEMLTSLLTSGEEGRPDWGAIKARDQGGSAFARVSFEQIARDLKRGNRSAGSATQNAIALCEKGAKYADEIEHLMPSNAPRDFDALVSRVSSWRDSVVAFASQADTKLGTPLINSNAFLPPMQPESGNASSAEMVTRLAQYKLSETRAQLNASREHAKAATDKLMDVTANLGDILAQVAGINVQRVNWEEISAILLRAINFLCQLKMYLNNLVHFFGAVYNLVSVTLQDATKKFIQIVKDATLIEAPGPRERGAVTLDAWARQAIYNHALSAAKISRLVENISGMYVTLYDGNVHPGVNMLLGMGALVGSGDKRAIAAAGDRIQDWAEDASNRIASLVVERMRLNEDDIRRRIEQLEKSLGGILPPAPAIEMIVSEAEAEVVLETARAAESAAAENPVYKEKTRARVFV
ncbi:hypothetical protein BD413DRAFT_666104 [Trametes elegans]|nr:hypothetical protein BD413DRAFT_666104 [Trametes elegans]